MVPIAETKNLHPWAASLFDVSQAATAETGPGGLHSDVSDSYVRLTGFDALTLASMRLSDLVHPEDRRRLAEAEAVGLGDFYRLELRLGAGCGGQPVWVRLTGRAVADFRRILLEDITVAKRDQLALLAAKDRFECAVRGTAEGIWDWNVLTGEDYFSDRWCDLLGYSHNELRPNYATWVELLHPDDREAALAAVKAHLSEQTPYDLEYRMRTKSGSYCWYRARGQAVWDESGRPVRMAGSISDIHRRKLDELRLTEWHNRYEAAVSVSGHVVYEWHPENGQVVWSGNLGALLGEPDSQSSPGPAEWIERVHPDDRHAMIGAMHRFVDCRGSFHHEYRLRKHDGSYMFVEGAARFYRDGSGALNRAIGWLVDVSERKRLEVELLQANERLEQRVAARTQELEETRQRLALALDGAREGVWDWSAPHTWEFSPEFEALLGFESGQLILGGNLEIHPEDTESVAAGFQAHRVGSSPLWESEHRLRTRSGDWMWVLARGKAVVRDSVGMALRIVGTIADIGARKEIDARLRQAVDAAEGANRAKSLFLATMSHEIRTPMNGILGMSELLSTTSLNQEQREFTSQIRTSADNLLVVIDDILDFSKIEAGKVDIENVPFDLVEVVEDAVAVLGLKAEAKGIELLCDMDVSLVRRVSGDPTRIRQILLNLLSNAVKFTSSGSVTAAVRLQGADAMGARVRFEVRDTGIGISREAQARLFQSFSQVDGSITRRFGGTGLGLAISRQLVQLMGGSIGVESEPGRGSTFWFEMPLSWSAGSSVLGEAEFLRNAAVTLVDLPAPLTAILTGYLNSWGMKVCDPLESSSTVIAGDHAVGLAEILAAAGSRQTIIVASDARSPSIRAAGGEKVGVLLKPLRASELLSRLRCSTIDAWCPMPAGGWALQVRRRSGDAVVGARILLAEDNPINQRVAVSMLEKNGAKVDLAANGLIALRLALLNQYDAILMDCHMPEIDGFEATRRIRLESDSDQRRVPIIALTASALIEDRQLCLDAGMDDFISKPFRSQRLLEVLTQWIEAQRC